jgi:putative DNA primase/helicase
MDYTEFLALLQDKNPRIKETANGHDACCPAHDDAIPSLGVAKGDDGRILLNCRSGGCSAESICKSLGLTLADLYPSNNGHHANGGAKASIVATYDYVDEEGKLLFQVCRKSDKKFFQRRPDGSWGIEGVRRVVYRLPAVVEAVREGLTIFIAEGEKDVHSLERLGLTATTNPMGAGKWLACYNETLRGAAVVIFPDNDDSGRAHAKHIANSLTGIALSVKYVELPGLPHKGDVSDWIAAGGTKVGLLKLVEAAPVWESNVEIPERDNCPDRETKDDAIPVVRTVSTITPKSVSWLWRLFIPSSTLTILDGDPGLGKSTITIDLTARVSRGWDMPPHGGVREDGVPADVLMLSAEDDAETTIRPRLELAGANLSRVHILDAIRTPEGDRPPALPRDIDLMEALVRKHNVRLIIIDPFLAYLDADIDAHKDQDVRRCLYRLRCLAEHTECAILLIRHLNKLGHNTAIYRGGGSIGIIGACRSGLLVGRDPNDQNTFVLASQKSNLGRRPRSVSYKLDEVGDVARIAWIGETDLLANDILSHPQGDRSTKRGQCEDEMRDALSGGAMESTELNELLEHAGYTEATIKRARRVLGVKTGRVGYGKDGKWMAWLPEKPVATP